MSTLRITTFLVTLTLPMVTFAASLNVKPGVWETTTSSTANESNIPADTLAKIPPEMRARIEAKIKANQQPHVVKSCITQDDLNQNKMVDSPTYGSCTRKIISSSSNKMTMQSICPPPHTSRSQVTVEALTPEKMVGTIDIAQPKAVKIHIDIKGQWLTSSCAGIPPRVDWKAKMEAMHQRAPK